jgi:hypothetical protein
MAADRLMRQRVFAAMPVAAQIRWLEEFEETWCRLDDPSTETTGQLIDGPDQRTDADSEE